MDDQPATPARYAVLIGIDAYPEKPLKGCERDVEMIRIYLEKQTNVHLQVLTTARNASAGNLDKPGEKTTLWPTSENVNSALEKTLASANKGDFVYVHFSGHGTRQVPQNIFSNTNTGDLALVLLREDNAGSICLRGPILGRKLNAMVEKGLIVTLVLDCCFAGSVYRDDDTNIRFLPYDPDIASTSLPVPSGGDATRDASMRPSWLIDPDRYSILAACDNDKKAAEYKFDGKQTQGALSYFLSEFLKNHGPNIALKFVVNDLRAKFLNRQLDQTPLLFGRRDQGFFGHAEPMIAIAPVPVVEKRDGTLRLLAGRAHGVCEGDLFALRLTGSPGHDLASAKVLRARGLTSDLQKPELASVLVSSGWMGRTQTRSSLQKFLIRLHSDLDRRDEVSAELRARSFQVSNSADEAPDSIAFGIRSTEHDEYEILGGSGARLPNLPPMPQSQTSTRSLGNIMEHLGCFELVRQLDNGDVAASDLRNAASAKIIRRSGEVFVPGSVVDVKHSKEYTYEVLVENKGTTTFYASIYDLGPGWQIQNMLKAPYEAVPPQGQRASAPFRGTMRKRWWTQVPHYMLAHGHRECNDIIKVFVTSQPSCFDMLELPKLGELLSQPPDRGEPPYQGGATEDWVAFSFTVRTTLDDGQGSNAGDNDGR